MLSLSPYDSAFLLPIPFIQYYLKITMNCLRRAGGFPHLSTAVAKGMKTSEQRRLAVHRTLNSLLQHRSVKASKCFLLQSDNMLIKKNSNTSSVDTPGGHSPQALSGVWERRALSRDVQSLSTMLEVKLGIASAPAYSYSFSESYGQWLRRQNMQEASKKKKKILAPLPGATSTAQSRLSGLQLINT